MRKLSNEDANLILDSRWMLYDLSGEEPMWAMWDIEQGIYQFRHKVFLWEALDDDA